MPSFDEAATPLVPDEGDLVRENAKLRRIVDVLMARVEAKTDEETSAFSHFETAITLERRVKARTRDLEEALELLNVTNARLAAAMRESERANRDLTDALEAFDEGFAMFDAHDVLRRRNSRFVAFAPDIAERVRPGIRFEEFVALMAASDHLRLPPGYDRQSWCTTRLAAHAKQRVNFNAELIGDRWVRVSEQRTVDGGTTVLHSDVTDTVRIEREERDKLLDSQARIVRATLDHLDQGVAVFDDHARLAGWNARLQMLLSPPLALLRRGARFDRIVEVLAADFVERGSIGGMRHTLSAWAGGHSQRGPLRLELEAANGTILSLHGDGMAEGGFIVSLTDVTAERAATAALARANETLESRVSARTAELASARDAALRANASKTRFLAAASHDLLQPLNAAKLYVTSLADMALDEPQRGVTERVRRALGSVEGLLGTLLDISKLDAGGVRPQVVEIPLERLFEALRSDFGHVAARKGLALRVLPTSAVVLSDPGYLQRVLQNLVSNAIRYTAEGRIVVGLRRVGEDARILVGDTGCGIAEDDQRAVFEEFRRLANAQAAAGDDLPGMGLGLAIVERACRMLNHELTLTSRPGRGSLFGVSLPLVRVGHAPPASARMAADRVAPDLEGAIVMVVEPDCQGREAMVHMLEGWGASAVAAASSAEAAGLISELDVAPDVVIAEHRLAGEDDGLSLMARLRREHPDFLGILTASARPRALRAAAAEASLFVRTKPVDPDDLAALLLGRVAARRGD
ncbi:MAG: PAS-domain containing protein [Pseudomonadota bacterium]